MPEVAPLAAVLIALMAVLLMWALMQFGKVVAHLFPSSIGVSLATIHPRQWVLDGVSALESAIKWVLGDVIRPIISVTMTPVMRFLLHLSSVFDVATALGALGSWIVEHALPEVLHAAKVYAASLAERAAAGLIAPVARRVAALSAAIWSYAHSLSARISTLSGNIWSEVHHVEAAVIPAVISKVDTLSANIWSEAHSIAADVDTLRTNIWSEVHSVEADVAHIPAATAAAIAGAIPGVERAIMGDVVAYVGSNVLPLITDIPGEVADSLSGLIDDVGSLAGTLASDFPDISGLIKSLDLSKIGDLAGIIGLSLTLARVATRLAEQCTVPNCRNLSKYGRDLQGLLHGVEDAAFLAVILEAVHDPSGFARDVDGLLSPAAGAIRSTVDAMAGI